MRTWIIAAAALLLPHIPAAEAQPGPIMICAENNGWYNARANITFYTRGVTGSETREDTGWRSLSMGERVCYNRTLVRAFNVTIQAWNGSSHLGACDINRRETDASGYVRSAIVTSSGDLVRRSCSVMSP